MDVETFEIFIKIQDLPSDIPVVDEWLIDYSSINFDLKRERKRERDKEG